MHMDRQRNRQLSQRKNDKYNTLILSGMEIPDSVYTQKKAQENQSKMAETPVPSLILSLSVSTVITMLVATTYNIVATYFVADLGESAVAAVGLMFSHGTYPGCRLYLGDGCGQRDRKAPRAAE